MAKIARKAQKIFGSTAGASEICEFGSFAAGSVAYTTDPDVIQTLSNYLEGWFSAVVGSNSPTMEDMNALFYLYAYQLAYLFQEGVAEWNATTVYYIGSIVSNGTGTCYVSLTDSNTGNALTDNTKWKLLGLSTVGSHASPTTVGGVTGVPVANSGDEDIYIQGVPAWTTQTLAEGNQLTGIAWAPALGLFAACSSDGSNRIQTSPDGVTWTVRTTAVAFNCQSICWSPRRHLFVAVGIDGSDRIQTSPDGITWTAVTAPELNSWFSVCWAEEIETFVAVATSGTNRVMISNDGVSWAVHTAAEANGWQSVCWSAELGLFIAVATGGTHRVMTSPTGVTWTAHTASEASSWYSVTWSKELSLLVAVANSGTNRVMSSPDGTTWTSHSATGANVWQVVQWIPELHAFFAGATGGTGLSMYSLDGTNWVAITDTIGTNSIAFSPPLNRIVGGISGNARTYSPVLISANPQIAAGTAQGQRLTIIGTDGVHTAQIDDGRGVALDKSFVAKRNTAKTFIWDTGQSLWVGI